MIFLINKTYLIYVPFFSYNGHEYRNPLYFTLLLIELILTVISVIWTFRVCWIVWKVRVFHVNMSIISNFYFLQYFEVIIGKGLMGLYQYGFCEIPGIPKNQHFLSWASSEKSKMPKIDNPDDGFFMFLGCFLIWHYMMSMVFFIFFYCLERVFATVLLGSYEKHSRSYISISILVSANFLTLTVTYLLFFIHITFLESVWICSAVVVISVIMYVGILLVNVRINSLLKNNTFKKRKTKFDKYSLAYRFQLEENLRAFQLARKVIIWIGAYIFINILVIFLINLDILPSSVNLALVFVVENCIYLNPLLICTVTVTGIEPWRKYFFKDFNFIIRPFRRAKIDVDQKIELEKIPAVANETEIYFRDLNALWA